MGGNKIKKTLEMMVMNMTMTYYGKMVMPKNYAVVTEDEMTYVYGGAKKYIWTISSGWCNTLAVAVCIVGGLFTVLCGLTAILSGVATICSWGSTAAILGYLWLASTRNEFNINKVYWLRIKGLISQFG